MAIAARETANRAGVRNWRLPSGLAGENCSSWSPMPSQAVPCTGAMMGIGITTAGM